MRGVNTASRRSSKTCGHSAQIVKRRACPAGRESRADRAHQYNVRHASARIQGVLRCQRRAQRTICARTCRCGEPLGMSTGCGARREEGHEGLPRRRRTDERGEHGVTEILQDLRALSFDRREERRANRVNQLVGRMSLRGRPRHGSHDTRVGGWRRWAPPPPPVTPRPHRLSSRGDWVAKVVERAPVFGGSGREITR